jgi:hypothetical protein
VTDGFQEAGWFTPEKALKIIRYPYMKKASDLLLHALAQRGLYFDFVQHEG